MLYHRLCDDRVPETGRKAEDALLLRIPKEAELGACGRLSRSRNRLLADLYDDADGAVWKRFSAG